MCSRSTIRERPTGATTSSSSATQSAARCTRAETFKEAFEKALRAAGVTERVRPFHDLRHICITNDAAAGASPIAVMAKAGHANMRTTQTYLHLAGVVFRDEAERLEARLLAAELSTEFSTRLSEHEPLSSDVASLNGTKQDSAD